MEYKKFTEIRIKIDENADKDKMIDEILDKGRKELSFFAFEVSVGEKKILEFLTEKQIQDILYGAVSSIDTLKEIE